MLNKIKWITMSLLNVFLYDNIEDCQNDINVINKELGIPKNENSITQTYSIPMKFEDKYYIEINDVVKNIINRDVSVINPETSEE